MNSCIFLLLISCLCNNNCGLGMGNRAQNSFDCDMGCDDNCVGENNSNVRGDECEHHHGNTGCGCDIPEAWQRNDNDCDMDSRRDSGNRERWSRNMDYNMRNDDRRRDNNDCGCMNNGDMRMSPPPIRNNDCNCNR